VGISWGVKARGMVIAGIGFVELVFASSKLF
jgi:hypothetical protein